MADEKETSKLSSTNFGMFVAASNCVLQCELASATRRCSFRLLKVEMGTTNFLLAIIRISLLVDGALAFFTNEMPLCRFLIPRKLSSMRCLNRYTPNAETGGGGKRRERCLNRYTPNAATGGGGKRRERPSRMTEIPKRKLENLDLHASDKYMETTLEDIRRNELENYKQSLDIRRLNIEFANKTNMTFQKSATGQHDDADPTRDVPGFYLLEDYQKLFQSVDDEHVQEDVEIEGILPAGLSGVYYITGPGILMQDDGETNVHPFDGHGLIRRFQIDGKRGRVSYKSRFVRTEAFKHEAAALNSKLLDKLSVSDDKATKAGGKASFSLKKRWTSSMPFLKRGVGTNVEIFRNFLDGRTGEFLLVQRNPSNTCVIPVGRNKLLSTFERGLPFLIDTDTLETIGDLDFRGALHDRQVLAHSRYDAERNVFVIIGVSQRYYNFSLEIMQDV